MARKIEYVCDKVGNFRLLGFATGAYNCTCSNCGFEFLGDKRSRQCLTCAIKLVEEKLTTDNKQSIKLPKCPEEKCRKFDGVAECLDCIRDENKADLFESL